MPAFIKPRLIATRSGSRPPMTAVATFGAGKQSERRSDEWRHHFPVGVFADNGLLTIRDLVNGGTKQITMSDPGSIVEALTHPDSGLAANGLRYIMWTNGTTGKEGASGLSAKLESTPLGGYFWHVVAPVGDVDNEWFQNEGISHTDAEADAVVAPIIAAYENHPSVLAYNFWDDLFGATEEARYRTLAQAMRRAETLDRPPSAVNASYETRDAIAEESGLILIYTYPCGYYANNTPTLEGDFHRSVYNPVEGGDFDWVDALRNRFAGLPAGTRIWQILQAHQTVSGAASRLRYPTAREMRMQVWIAIGEGANGLFWFNWPDQTDVWDGLGSVASTDRRVAAAEMAHRLTPDIRRRLLTTTKVADAFTASGGGSSGYPVNYANAYVSTLYDADADIHYCVVCNHSTSTANVTISSASLAGDLVNCETGVRYPLGSAISFPALDGGMFWLDNVPGVPDRQVHDGIDVNDLWANDWANPASAYYKASADIVLHPNVVNVVNGDDLQAKVDAAPNYTTFSIGPGTYGEVELIGRSHLHFVAADPLDKPIMRGFPRVFGNTYAMWINPTAEGGETTTGYVHHLVTLKTEEALWHFRNPAEDFIFRNLHFSSDGSLCVYEYFNQGFISGPSVGHDHWVSHTPFFFRNVRNVLIEDCDFDNNYLWGNDPGPPPAVSTYTGIPGHPHTGYVNGNAGIDNVTVRNCTGGPSQGMPCAVFLDGSRGSVVYNNDWSLGTVTWHVGDVMFFTNDDFAFDSNNDGRYTTDQDNRNANRNMVVGNTFEYGAGFVVALQGHHNLVAENTVVTSIQLNRFVQIDSRCARYANRGQVYHHFGNVIRDNDINTNVLDSFVSYHPNNSTQCGGLCGHSIITGNDATGYTVAAWVADLAGEPDTSVGGDTVSGNTP